MSGLATAGSSAGSVLIVDDDPAIVAAMAEVLGDDGYAVMEARNGEAALQWLAENPPPDVILLDLMMPKMNGSEFRVHQLATPAIAGIPTYVLTAGGQARQPGMRVDGWFEKPVRLPSLLATLRRCCASRSAAPEHVVSFYTDQAVLVSGVAQFLDAALARGGAGVAFLTAPHAVAVRAALAAAGYDLPALEAAGWLQMGDAQEALAVLRGAEGDIDAGRFRARATPMLDRARALAVTAPVHVFGEIVDLLWRRGEYGAAVRLERLWNELARERGFALSCAYHAHAEAVTAAAFAAVRAQHAAVV